MEEPNEAVAERIMRELLGMNNSSSSSTNFHLNAGGVAVWMVAALSLATFACVIVGVVVGTAWLSREFSKQDREFTRQDSEFMNLKNQDQVHDAYIQKLRAEQKQEKKQ